ncbi:MAG: type II toxin-antitoxin system VapB family antitoxin [Candidatus Binatia bacterium]
MKKKTFNLDAEMIDKVRRRFGAKTETEAIQRALQKTLEDQEIEEALEKLLRDGRFRPLYR